MMQQLLKKLSKTFASVIVILEVWYATVRNKCFVVNNILHSFIKSMQYETLSLYSKGKNYDIKFIHSTSEVLFYLFRK